MSKGPVLICHRVADLPRPHVASHMRECRLCKLKVWAAFSSPKHQRVWCMQCAREEMADQPHDVQISATREQIADLKAYFAKRNRND